MYPHAVVFCPIADFCTWFCKVLKYIGEDGFIIFWTKNGYFLREHSGGGGWKSPPATKYIFFTPPQIGLIFMLSWFFRRLNKMDRWRHIAMGGMIKNLIQTIYLLPRKLWYFYYFFLLNTINSHPSRMTPARPTTFAASFNLILVYLKFFPASIEKFCLPHPIFIVCNWLEKIKFIHSSMDV